MKKTKNEKENVVVRRFYDSFKWITAFCSGFEINSKWKAMTKNEGGGNESQSSYWRYTW